MKVLPMKYPIITSYPYHADILSIVLENDETLPWFYNNYIQLELPDDPHNMRLDFYQPLLWKACPYIHYQRLTREMIEQKWGSIVDFAIDCIDQESYVYFLANYNYLPISHRYGKGNTAHDIFVYGYDLDQRKLHVADFFQMGKYSYERESFEHIEKSYNTFNLCGSNDWLAGVEVIKKRSDRLHRFDVRVVKMRILEYVNGVNSSDRMNLSSEFYKLAWYYGSSVYDKIAHNLELLSNMKTNPDFRPYHILYDHKVIMKERIKYLEQKKYLDESLGYSGKFSEIVSYMMLLRNNYIKATLKNDLKGYYVLRDSIIALKEKEKSLLLNMCNDLDCTDGIRINNIAESACIASTSINLHMNFKPDNVSKPDIDQVYISDHNPSFPVHMTLKWDAPQTFNHVEMKTRFARNVGVTSFTLEALSEDGEKWEPLAELRDIAYQYESFEVETVHVNLEKLVSTRALRITILEACTDWGRFEINWIGVYWDL